MFPADVHTLLERDGVPKSENLHVLVDEDSLDPHAVWVFTHNYLNRYGYTKVLPSRGGRRGVSTSEWTKEEERLRDIYRRSSRR